MRTGVAGRSGALLCLACGLLLFSSAARGNPLPSVGPDSAPRESLLLHRPIPAELLSGLNLWDTRFAEWRAAAPSEQSFDPSAVVLIHFWAPWCKPCVAELPLWLELAPRLQAAHPGRLRVLFVTLQTNQTDMERFLASDKQHTTKGTWWLDVAERLTALLQKGLPDERLPLPATIWLDSARVVRQALLGSIAHRRSEVIQTTERLIALQAQRSAAPISAVPPRPPPGPAGQNSPQRPPASPPR